MAWETKGECDYCKAKFGPLVDFGATICLCQGCGEYHSIKRVARRFGLPLCDRCGHRYLKSNLVDGRSSSHCPHCGMCQVSWTYTTHLLIKYEEVVPQIGETAQGYIRNTGYIQRIEFVNSTMLGRIGSHEPEFEDGTAVEAEISGIGSRSLNVKNVRPIPEISRRKQAN